MRAIILLLAIGCATGANHQVVSLRSKLNAAAPPVRISVGKGHISGGGLNAFLEEGCVHGTWYTTPVVFCRDDKMGDGPVQHWSGASGEFTVRTSEDGERLEVDGYWLLDLRRQASMANSLELGVGPEWDELRKNPALLAVAATAADLQATGINVR